MRGAIVTVEQPIPAPGVTNQSPAGLNFTAPPERPSRAGNCGLFALLNHTDGRANRALDQEQTMNYVPSMFETGEGNMFRAVIEEAAALASITLFVGMIVVWAEVLCSL